MAMQLLHALTMSGLLLSALPAAAAAVQDGEDPSKTGAAGGAGGAQGDQAQAESAPPADEEDDEAPKDPRMALIESLMEDVARLRQEISDLRHEIATVTLERDEATRELEELRGFIRDHREFGDDFAQYQEVKELTRQAERRRAAEEARQRREEERQRRLAARNIDGAVDDAQRAAQEKIEQLQRAGFQHLGLDIFLGRTGFFYGIREDVGGGFRVEYEPIIGHFLEPATPLSRVDYSRMKISGTILNASQEVRNIGIAVAFFDRSGNQVGSETFQINNARPNVPYPFDSTIDMGLDGPFASSTSWVLYADPAESADNP